MRHSAGRAPSAALDLPANLAPAAVRQFITYLCSSGFTVSATKMSPFGAIVM